MPNFRVIGSVGLAAGRRTYTHTYTHTHTFIFIQEITSLTLPNLTQQDQLSPNPISFFSSITLSILKEKRFTKTLFLLLEKKNQFAFKTFEIQIQNIFEETTYQRWFKIIFFEGSTFLFKIIFKISIERYSNKQPIPLVSIFVLSQCYKTGV